MARTDPQLNIRLPADLIQRIADEATANKRSTNAEIVHRLDGAGMSLRDWFAGHALNALLSAENDPGQHTVEQWAMWAYDQADAMIEARSK